MPTLTQRIETLSQAVSRGELIDSNLNTMNKKSLKWKIEVVLRTLLRPIYYILGKDAFQSYRVQNVAKAILTLCQKQSADLNPHLKAKIVTHIFGCLEDKTKGKYGKIIQNTQEAVLVLGLSQSDPTVQRKNLVQKAIHQIAYAVHSCLSQSSVGSICFSPLSLMVMFGMVLKGMTADQKRHLLQKSPLKDLPEPMIHIAIQEILRDCTLAGGLAKGKTKLNIAQALAVPKTSAEAYREIAKTYKAEMFPISDSGAKASSVINQWFSKKIDVQNLTSPSDFPVNPFALLNAIHFEGQWEKSFGPVTDSPFTFADGSSGKVKMMPLLKNLKGHQGDSFRMLEIPYQSPEGHQLAYLVFLPNRGEDLSALEIQLGPEFIADCRKSATTDLYDVRLPKTEVTVRIDDLLEILEDLDLPMRNMGAVGGVLTKMIHQVTVNTDPHGTIAKAATAAIGSEKSILSGAEQAKRFYVDRSFVYCIVDRNQIVLQGNIRSPEAVVLSAPAQG